DFVGGLGQVNGWQRSQMAQDLEMAAGAADYSLSQASTGRRLVTVVRLPAADSTASSPPGAASRCLTFRRHLALSDALPKSVGDLPSGARAHQVQILPIHGRSNHYCGDGVVDVDHLDLYLRIATIWKARRAHSPGRGLNHLLSSEGIELARITLAPFLRLRGALEAPLGQL